MTIKEKLYTAEEPLRLPDDGMRYELVGGDKDDGAGGKRAWLRCGKHWFFFG